MRQLPVMPKVSCVSLGSPFSSQANSSAVLGAEEQLPGADPVAREALHEFRRVVGAGGQCGRDGEGGAQGKREDTGHFGLRTAGSFAATLGNEA